MANTKGTPAIGTDAQPLSVNSSASSDPAPTVHLVLHRYHADGSPAADPQTVEGTPEEVEQVRAAAESELEAGGYARLGES